MRVEVDKIKVRDRPHAMRCGQNKGLLSRILPIRIINLHLRCDGDGAGHKLRAGINATRAPIYFIQINLIKSVPPN